ncbi:hypothetical protein LCP9604111_7382 [Penicillium roqueforti]|uniref:uncharacterized protein n=1 Tax=Penicillium roqueforti TaxID=5082 RepID=UPI00190AAC94|nr:uncharacterized protein LCP9604111_7382 [Penicillium roqueforti]KAF9244429.1 hypothetical protein LCP9604111_7382 [Penicillium roqueforti]KAI2699024.1 hypothetical protein CBS147372_6871 [Penicillium roqueforti]KAI3121891.1 hypothetical protein CBS147326_9096 [Penicillium roqueforti]KAI3225628.1 hypothetical protein DTO012A9_9521 [Penicillium roqueforti]
MRWQLLGAPLIVGLSLRYAQLFFTATDHSNHYTIASISLNMPRAIPRMFSRAPDCCGAQMSRRQTSSNYNGNRDRWRYFCRNCPLIAGNHELLLDSAWDDSLGQAAFERAQLDWGDIIYLENGEVTVSCPNFRQLREFDQGSIYVATYMRLQEPSGWCLTDSRRRTSVLSLQKEALRIFCLQRGS